MKKPKTLRWKNSIWKECASLVKGDSAYFLEIGGNGMSAHVNTKSQAMKLSKWLKEASRWLKN